MRVELEGAGFRMEGVGLTQSNASADTSAGPESVTRKSSPPRVWGLGLRVEG